MAQAGLHTFQAAGRIVNFQIRQLHFSDAGCSVQESCS
jgi:hypothetical protein